MKSTIGHTRSQNRVTKRKIGSNKRKKKHAPQK